VITNNVKKQDTWAMRLLIVVCENVFSWILRHEFGVSPHESSMFMTCYGVGWEEAIMYHSMVRIKQVQDREA